MRLYYKPGACSLAARIVLKELGETFESVRVDTAAGLTEHGSDYRTINPKGYVPALELEPGVVLTENPAILQYLADLHPEAGLAPAPATLSRARLQEWMNFTSSELHKAFGPYFSARAPEGEAKTRADATLARRLDNVELEFADGREYALGGHFSVADAYLFVVLSWTAHIGMDLAAWPALAAYVERISQRPAVRAALAEEGLISTETAA